MDTLKIAETVRDACLQAAIQAYEEAGVAGLCHEGRWELAVQEMRSLNLHSLINLIHD